jgi:hypothetical protein
MATLCRITPLVVCSVLIIAEANQASAQNSLPDSAKALDLAEPNG